MPQSSLKTVADMLALGSTGVVWVVWAHLSSQIIIHDDISGSDQSHRLELHSIIRHTASRHSALKQQLHGGPALWHNYEQLGGT